MNDSCIADFLADTWWFSLTQRLSEADFKNLAQLRVEQGFSVIQLVVGLPPEVGPENENGRSPVGFPWTLDGVFNQAYLELARDRIEYLNNLGLLVIVYGAWGHQIKWLGKKRMVQWWCRVIETLDSLNVIYCLSGESNLWVGKESKLLPAKSTDDLLKTQALSTLNPKLRNFLVRAVACFRQQPYRNQLVKRRGDWSFILENISRKTDKPIIVHPVSSETGYEAVSNPGLLAANTAQTGHDVKAKNRLWRLPLGLLKDNHTNQIYINLEPWYEGIRNQFWTKDQLFAYWVSMLAGAVGHCYGAQGIWNVGDGKFLAHWGTQTFAQALALDTPRLLGLSHKQYLLQKIPEGEVFYQTENEELIMIGRKMGQKTIQFFPDVSRANDIPTGKVWLTLEGRFTQLLPADGPAVIFTD